MLINTLFLSKSDWFLQKVDRVLFWLIVSFHNYWTLVPLFRFILLLLFSLLVFFLLSPYFFQFLESILPTINKIFSFLKVFLPKRKLFLPDRIVLKIKELFLIQFVFLVSFIFLFIDFIILVFHFRFLFNLRWRWIILLWLWVSFFFRFLLFILPVMFLRFLVFHWGSTLIESTHLGLRDSQWQTHFLTTFKIYKRQCSLRESLLILKTNFLL